MLGSKVYDEEGIIKRMEGGLIDRGARNIDDPNMVTIVFICNFRY
jgi:hypothetical protein